MNGSFQIHCGEKGEWKLSHVILCYAMQQLATRVPVSQGKTFKVSYLLSKYKLSSKTVSQYELFPHVFQCLSMQSNGVKVDAL